MAVKPNTSIENNFTAGLKTEFTGLNFPENAATDVDNCVFTLIGDVLRREGIDFEPNYVKTNINRDNQAISTYKWNNAGGDGLTQIVVVQVGNTLYFFQSSAATITSPLSANKLTTSITLSTFLPAGSGLTPSLTECQYADGNGYLFVYHPNLDPFYCTYSLGTVTGNVINVQIRDFLGVPEASFQGLNGSVRPLSSQMTAIHGYNLANQGWGKSWADTTATTITPGVTTSFVVTSANNPIVVGDAIQVFSFATPGAFQNGVVTSYVGTTITISLTKSGGVAFSDGLVRPYPNLVDKFVGAILQYPSNSDIWFSFKDTTNTFNPATTATSRSAVSGPAPQGSFILSAFNQDRANVAGYIPALNVITVMTTQIRPKTGTWFQGRVWYTGVDASFKALDTAPNYSWAESIYFSQVVTGVSDFGHCFQVNNPTSDGLFDLLPTDGGEIKIQGCGSIYKLFPIQNGLLVFAANGIWFITGSQGIGFAANDYTVTKIDSTQSISSTSFINVRGYPVFWNEEGIYTVSPSKQGGGLTVDNLTLGTILSYYANIPMQSKKFARGDYNQIDYEIQWCFKSSNEISVTDRYQFDKILVYNIVNKAFYIYTLPKGLTWVHDIRYVVGPGGTTSPDPVFKYLTSSFAQFTFSDEHDTSYRDWKSADNVGLNYISTFTTGYRVHGQGIGQWQPVYLYMYLRNNTVNGYKIQSVWNYATSGNSGQFSSVQVVNNYKPNFGMVTRRHKLRGHGLAFQLKVSSVDGLPFDVMGWTVYEMVNTTP